MKKVLGFLFAFLLMIPTVSLAHTHVQTTVPEDGAIVSEPLTEIKLSFETHIEEVSTMTVTKDGEEVTLDSQQVNGHDLIGTSEKPLPNGQYEVKWDIVGEDGHVMKDSVAFEVSVPEQADTSGDEETTNEEAQDKNPVADEETATPDNEAENETTNSSFFVIMIVAVLAVALALIFIFRKKKG
ncbi:copper resistance protein CopC [Priestia megaterium]|nr:copper resistance protein CopC [Priestia megaterium]